jgi:biotin carboxylase
MVLVLLARNPTDTVTYGLLPAAERLGLAVRVLTDHPAQHRAVYEELHQQSGYRQPEVVGCQVTEVRAVLAAVGAGGRPDALLSNSDHLQVQTALAADYFGLIGKDWRAAARARDKGLMRAALRAAAMDDTPFIRVRPDDPAESLDHLLGGVRYPAVLKPAEGVASEDVVLVRDRADLGLRLAQTRSRRDGDLLVEGFLDGPLRTLETIGDGQTLRVWGGYRTQVSPPPFFIEERLTWQPTPSGPVLDSLLAQLAALGVGFGPCHTEFILTAAGPRIVEVNDRLIGDHADFLMADLLDEPVFDDVIGVHLGQPVRDTPPQASGRYGLAHYVVAESDGVLAAEPGRISLRGAPDAEEPWLDYWPIRETGAPVRITGTNRDYLGTLRVTGPDPESIEFAAKTFLSSQHWVITPDPAGI